MKNLAGVITLTTDFGLADPYVGLMKGVIASIAPDARVVDLTHGVPAQNVLAGALAIESALGYFPDGTIHVGVVDPGVGTARDPVAIRTARGVFVGPDNGLFNLALRREPAIEAVRLDEPRYHREPLSETFHGRDIFSPAAAHLVTGVSVNELGSAKPIGELVTLDLPEPEPTGDRAWLLRVLRVDRFGNLITNLTADDLAVWNLDDAARQHVVLRIGDATVHGIHATFGAVDPGEPVAYLGSTGRLEIAVRNGNAAQRFGIDPGDSVHVDA